MPESKPRILDAYCGAGGCSRGYMDAGFEAVGIDLVDQPRYPYPFVQMDALKALTTLLEGKAIVDRDGHPWRLRDFSAISASPPCQGYSIMNNLPWLKGREYPLLILPTLELLEQTGKPYVLENVMGAKHGAEGLKKRGLEAHGLKAGWLCGSMFGLPFYRHRLFATNWFWLAPGHPKHQHNGTGKGNPVNSAWRQAHDGTAPPNWPNGFRQKENPNTLLLDGHPAKAEVVRASEMLGIDWMTRKELTQAIPPAYCRFLGARLLAAIEAEQEART